MVGRSQVGALGMTFEGFSPSVLDRLLSGTFEGFVTGIPNSDYHGLGKYFSSTQLKYLYSKSPFHFKAKYIDKKLERDRPTAAMILGSSVHSLVLTPSIFDTEFFVMPKADGRTKEGKELKAKAEIEAASRIVIDEELYKEAQDISNQAIYKFHHHLEKSEREVSFFWKCSFSGIMFKGRFDAFQDGDLLELKTTNDASLKGFARNAYNMNYDLSLSHYSKGMEQLGLKPKRQIFLAVETEKPYAAQAYLAGDSFITTGHNKWLDAVSKLEVGLTSDVWVGYVDEEIEALPALESPHWAQKDNSEIEIG